MRKKMARLWVRLGGKTGSHVSLAEVYGQALSRPHFHAYTISDELICVNEKKWNFQKIY